MPLKLNREPLSGHYDGVTNPLLLPEGSISDGQNVRHAGPNGGWKGRRGCTVYNSGEGAGSAPAMKSFFDYEHPVNGDYHFVVNSTANLYDCNVGPPPGSVHNDLSSETDLGIDTGSARGFGCTVKDHFFFASSTTPPVTYGGLTPFCSGFLVYRTADGSYTDCTVLVADSSDSTYATLGSASGDYYLVGMHEPGHGISLTFGTPNTKTVTVSVSAWRSGAWAAVSGLSDGTSTTETHDTDGSLTWTASASDEMSVLGGIMAYWYRVSFSAAVDAVTIKSCKVAWSAHTLTNKWDGVYRHVSGFLYYDTSDYRDSLGVISNAALSQCVTLSSATTAAALYVKTQEPACGFAFGIVPTKNNTADAQINSVKTWTGNEFTSMTFRDETLDGDANSSFSTSGTVWLTRPSAVSPQKRVFQGDSVPGYWYEIKWDATLLATTAIYLSLYAEQPEALGYYDGCVEFNGALVLWGDKRYPNRLRVSKPGKPDSFNAGIASFSGVIGDSTVVKNAIVLNRHLIVWKGRGVWAVARDYSIEQIAGTVGLAGEHTACVSEIGLEGFKRDELVHVAIWQDIDGVYMMDGKTIKKISSAISNYFDEEFSTEYLSTNLLDRVAYIDQIHNEYHLLLPTKELVYDIDKQTWIPPFVRNQYLSYAKTVVMSDGRKATYGIGTPAAQQVIYRLEVDTTDKNASGQDVAITQDITTRAFTAENYHVSYDFGLGHIWQELDAAASGNVAVTLYPNQKTSGVSLGNASLVNSGYDLALPSVCANGYRAASFQFKFSVSTADLVLKIYGLAYSAQIHGKIQ